MLPAQIDEMSMQDLEDYIDGFKIREARKEEGTRTIFATIVNAFTTEKKHKLSHDALVEMWPLYTDKPVDRDAEANELRERMRTLVKNIKDADERNGFAGDSGSANN